MIYKKAYIDIEASYVGDLDPERNKDEYFKDYNNWVFHFEYPNEGRIVEYKGIIGIFLLTVDIDENTGMHKILDHKFIQMLGKGCSKENLIKYLEGVNEVLTYHGRTKTDHKGRTGYDFGVIGANCGIIIDQLPDIKSTDLEIICHSEGIYGGLKKTEELLPGIPPRKSGIANGLDAEKLLLEAGRCTDEEKKKEMYMKARLYNKEDCTRLIYIEQIMKKIRYDQD